VSKLDQELDQELHQEVLGWGVGGWCAFASGCWRKCGHIRDDRELGM
jgi:hypothetical protein